jgi:hypothetical protein
MKRIQFFIRIATAAMSLAAVPLAFAAKDKPAKERTLTGEAKCAKCALKEADTCQNVIVTDSKKGKSQTVYLEQNDVAKAFHENFCKDAKKVTATGTVKKDGKKLVMTASKIELVK